MKENMLRFEREQQERVVYCFLKMPIISSKTNDELTFQYHVSFVLMNKMVLYLNIFLIILNVQKDSLSYSWYNWNWIGWTCTSYEPIFILFFLLFVNTHHWFVISAIYSNCMPFMYLFNVSFGEDFISLFNLYLIHFVYLIGK
jgi:hypothetical protein